jgi:lysozyme
MDKHKLIEELKRDEGCVLHPYRDSMDILTIGVGRNLEAHGISMHEAEVMLSNDIDNHWKALLEALPWVEQLSEARQRAMLNMAFNLGISGLLQFKRSLAALQAGDYPRAADMFLDSHWAMQVGDRAKRVCKMIREG